MLGMRAVPLTAASPATCCNAVTAAAMKRGQTANTTVKSRNADAVFVLWLQPTWRRNSIPQIVAGIVCRAMTLTA